MPTYDYICTACKHEFEEFQAMSAKNLKKCPKCGKPKLERKIGIGAGVLFKGGGFYETDYRSDSYKKAAEAESKPKDAKPDTKSDAKTETKSESKAEAKPESKPAAPPAPAAESVRASSARVGSAHKPSKPVAAKTSKRAATRKK